jgi:hypothetical protein
MTMKTLIFFLCCTNFCAFVQSFSTTIPFQASSKLPLKRSFRAWTNLQVLKDAPALLCPGHVRTSQHTPGISPAFFNRRRDAVSNQCRSKLTVVKAIEGTGLFLIKPARIGLFVNTFLALLGLVTQSYKKALTLSGLFHAWFLGVILWASLGFAGWSTCALYLVVGSLATKIKMKEKEAKGIAGHIPITSASPAYFSCPGLASLH